MAYSLSIVAGGKVNEADPDSAVINPAWRKALMHLVFWGTWEEGAPSQYIQGVNAWVKSHVDKLEALVPGSGAYFNEVCVPSLRRARSFTELSAGIHA